MENLTEKIKIVRKSGFTHIPNTPLRDESLTLQARGLFCVMLSLPEDWDFTVGGLARIAGCGRDKVRACLRNLEESGYLLREQGHAEDGSFAGNIYVLYDEKRPPLPENPSTGNPSAGNPLTENPTEQSKDITNERSIYPPISPQGEGVCRHKNRGVPRDAPAWKPERFEGMWKYYPAKGRKNKQRAMDAWDKLAPDDALIDRIARALARLMATEEWQRGIGIPHVATFLNGRRWEDADELDAPSPSVQASTRVQERKGDYEI